jgi:hypothetical protein
LTPAVVSHEIDDSAAKHPQEQQTGQQQYRRAKVLAFGNLALLAGLLPAMRSWLLRFVAVLFSHESKGKDEFYIVFGLGS